MEQWGLRGSSLIWCLWYVHFQTLMDLTSTHLTAWAGFQLEFELNSFKPFKPQPSVLWLSLAWHITSLRHCAGIQKETPGKLRYCLLPRLLILCGSFCLPFFSLHSWCTFRSTSSGSQAAQGQLWKCKSDGTSKYSKSCWELLRFFLPKTKTFPNLEHVHHTQKSLEAGTKISIYLNIDEIHHIPHKTKFSDP